MYIIKCVLTRNSNFKLHQCESWQLAITFFNLQIKLFTCNIYIYIYIIMSKDINRSRELDHKCFVSVSSLLHNRNGTQDGGILSS